MADNAWGIFTSVAALWWVVAIGLVIIELFVGSFHLLLIALGLAAAGLAAWLGFSLGSQILIAAAICIVGLPLLRYLRPLTPRHDKPEQSQDLHLDIGQTVTVEAWESNGRARITYRGSQWQAELLAGYPQRPGRHRIHGMHGSSLVLIPVESAAHHGPDAVPARGPAGGTPPHA